MNWITQLRRRNELCDELSAEIRGHLEERAQELVEAGMTPTEAAASARREFGNPALIEERGRETWHWMWIEDFLADARYGFRALRNNPGFMVVAVLTLALGIGANSAIFSVVNAVLLRSLPFAEPERLVSLSEHNWYPQGGFVAMRSSLRSMDVAAFLEGLESNLTGEGNPERLYGTAVSAEFFSLLGAEPELGRVFHSGDDQPGENSKVILSHALWQAKFNSDAAIVGRRIMLAGVSREVVAVMPADFHFGSPRTQYWVPFNLDPRGLNYWSEGWIKVIGRLRDGVSLSQARAELQTLQNRLLTMFPFKMPSTTWEPARVIPLQQQIVGDAQARLWILFGAITLVLLIACANVANLLLARAASRKREIAVRATLGAGRWRICRQLLVESTLLGVAGAAVGLAFAWVAVAWLKSELPADMPRLWTVSIDPLVLLFTAGVGILTGLFFGLVPALQLSKVDLTESLKTGSKNAVAASHRLRSGLAVSEIALAVILVTAAGLMVKSLWQLVHVDPGFRGESILSARVTPNEAFCDDFSRCQSFYNALLDRVRALPGVRGVALVNALPLNGRAGFIAARLEGYPEDLGNQAEPLLFDSVVTPEYLSVMQIPVVAGRGFTQSDSAPNAEAVALITASTAHKYWPEQNPIGKHLRAAWENDKQWRRVVGVVPDVREDSLARTLPAWINGAIYEPYSARAVLINRRPATEMTIVVRGTNDSVSFSNALRQVVLELNPEVPITEVQTLLAVMDRSVSAPRSIMALFAIFAGLAIVLGAVGVYGVISYSVAQRTSEIGVRMALGARRGDIQTLILGQGARIALLGVGIGLIGAVSATRLMASLLYGVTATDRLTYGAVAILLSVVAVAASYFPARRAMRLDPLMALRHE